MATPDEDARRYSLLMPVGEDLLAPLGRTTWAAIRLHSGVRDALNHLEPGRGDLSWAKTLGTAISWLIESADKAAAEVDRDALHAWADAHGRPAVERRNEVAHAISYTAEDGRQALCSRITSRRLLTSDLLEVAGLLGVASRELPPGPYRKTGPGRRPPSSPEAES